MAVQLRSVVGVVAAIALLVPLSGAVAALGDPRADHGAPAALTSASTRAPVPARPWPTGGPGGWRHAHVLLLAVSAIVVRVAWRDELGGRRPRRLEDVGDDWRSLLLGAPPRLS